MKYKYIELIQHSFSTILLDAIQFFPENEKKLNSECYGLLFGVEQKEHMECDFAFPTGSVAHRSESSVLADRKVDYAIQSAKQLFSTTNCIGAYHSHPVDKYFVDLANPSNTDIGSVLQNGLPFEVIIGITRSGKTKIPLSLTMMESSSFEYFYDENAPKYSEPDARRLDRKVAYIEGEFQKYAFTIRGYYNTGKSLIDIDLFSSEVDLLIQLFNEDININNLAHSETNRLRKMEYNMRGGGSVRSKNNNEYHLNKIKEMITDKY